MSESTPPAVFVDPLPSVGECLELEREQSHYLSRVLRARAGDPIRVLDGAGSACLATVRQIDRRRVLLAIESTLDDEPLRESPLAVRLAFGVLKSAKLEVVLQKATELGVRSFQPLEMSRTRERKRAAEQHARWQRIVLEAVRQCDRRVIPPIHPPLPLDALRLDLGERGLLFTTEPEAGDLRARLLDVVPHPGAVCLVFGAEGGLAEGETASLVAAGFSPVRLGPRILRAETAILAALSIVQHIWGDVH
ncbi:MAG: 16S rRNA (uracil(1498)-N(3))-methyltransferase [Myxococcales bacterium]|nr:16S rRNA (uracil(1498)-N(3))-methyltransferase [Myxococcales bacterium]